MQYIVQCPILIVISLAPPEEPSVQITASAISLNVADVPASAAFLISHFGVIVLLLDWNTAAGQ